MTCRSRGPLNTTFVANDVTQKKEKKRSKPHFFVAGCYLQVWDYSISQATLETIFMSFAKNQEEEVTSVPGVQYTDTENNNTTTRDDGPTGRPCTRRSMDVEMGRIGGGLLSSRQCGAGTASRETFAEQGETATFV